jgi:hypothetical protein
LIERLDIGKLRRKKKERLEKRKRRTKLSSNSGRTSLLSRRRARTQKQTSKFLTLSLILNAEKWS